MKRKRKEKKNCYEYLKNIYKQFKLHSIPQETYLMKKKVKTEKKTRKMWKIL